MKVRFTFLHGLLIFLLLAVPAMALENNVGGNAKVAGVGFTHVCNNSSFLGNPASFNVAKVSFSLANTELFGTGVVYNCLETAVGLKDNWRINFSYESVLDKDEIEDSGFSQEQITIGLSSKLMKGMQLGVSFTQNKYGLFDEVIGNGYAVNAGIISSPIYRNSSAFRFGVKVDNLVASRDYKTNRTENPKPEVAIGVSLKRSDLLLALDLKTDEFRCGAEYQALPSLILRGGLHNGEPTLGIGIVRGVFQLDYAYWLSNLNATHRIGAGISF